VNLTVKASPSSGYHTDVQKVKKKYKRLRRVLTSGFVVYWILFISWVVALLTQGLLPNLGALQAWIYALWNDVITWQGMSILQQLMHALWVIFITWQGWLVLVGYLVVKSIRKRLEKKKIHFQCPYCKGEIRINAPWDCPFCAGERSSYPILFHTFFDKCKHGSHKLESYKCPNCDNVFELIPNGKKDQFAQMEPWYKDHVFRPASVRQSNVQQRMQATPSPPPPPEQLRIGEVMPRDRNPGERNFFE